jgi:mono/diheme cytochrome c family protein
MDSSSRPRIDGDARRGKEIVRRYECGVCHVIPGVRGARGHVGPPLADYWRNAYIAGQLPNTASNLAAWIVDAPALAPRTAVPSLGVNARDARDIAAYLYSL